MIRLPILCAQQYDGTKMQVTSCTRCRTGWNAQQRRCVIESGCEHLAEVTPHERPTCPIQDRCQHEAQSEHGCAVRSRGMICESAIVFAGASETEACDHPLAFHALMM